MSIEITKAVYDAMVAHAQEIAPIEVLEYPCGAQVYDWVIPDEWIIRDAYIKGPDGRRIVDYRECNLHVVNYSEPIYEQMTFDELVPRLHILEDNPDVIPYRTSYYNRDWGFCVTGPQIEVLRSIESRLEVCIDSEFKSNGSMTVGELCIPGSTDEEYLVSTYCCHPSMANDNLSGLLVTALLAREMLSVGKPNRCWRFVFVPETIGAIAYLHHNEEILKNLLGGLVVNTCGGPGPFGYKESFLGEHLVDKAVKLVFRDRSISPIRYPFVPDGSDERQYSSPGFRIPMVTITRDKYYEYPQYHTSADNLDFVNGSQIADSLDIYWDVLQVLDRNVRFRAAVLNGEAQLGRRSLYPNTGGAINQRGVSSDAEQETRALDAITWLLFLADGNHDLLTVAEQSGVAYSELLQAADKLIDNELLYPFTY